jgi:CrcB protein
MSAKAGIHFKRKIIVNQAILILIGGGIGSLLRYWMAMGAYMLLGRSFPYGTLMVNVLGCLLMGLLTILLVERMHQHMDSLRALLLFGLLGGFTTFSSFSMETLSLFEDGAIFKACLNIVGSVSLCLLAVSLGVLVGRQIQPDRLMTAESVINQPVEVE